MIGTLAGKLACPGRLLRQPTTIAEGADGRLDARIPDLLFCRYYRGQEYNRLHNPLNHLSVKSRHIPYRISKRLRANASHSMGACPGF
jgi:hypothetical protein